MAGVLLRGLAAGAAGTTALNAVTYADMAVRGRAASEVPERAVEHFADRAGQDIPGSGEQRQHRGEGLAALSGIATGLGAGVGAAVLGPVLRRLPGPLAAATVAALAMAGADIPMVRAGLSDPREWAPADWLADIVPHLAYGAVAAWTLRGPWLPAGPGHERS